MCGRYSITTPVEALARLFRFGGPLRNLPPRYNVAPTQQVPIVRRQHEGLTGERDLAEVRWGLIPFWARNAPIGARMINVRAEGVADKPAFRRAFRQRRCLVPADGFYEWQKTGSSKQPWRITLKDGEPFAFAGLWERWEKAPDGVPVESCTIITAAANALVAKLHDRMPVILPAHAYPAWLGEDSALLPELRALLRPYPSEAMRAYRVSTAVNNVKNYGPECIEPAA
jgi:putative SOS response-associated peptidase YedK